MLRGILVVVVLEHVLARWEKLFSFLFFARFEQKAETKLDFNQASYKSSTQRSSAKKAKGSFHLSSCQRLDSVKDENLI